MEEFGYFGRLTGAALLDISTFITIYLWVLSRTALSPYNSALFAPVSAAVRVTLPPDSVTEPVPVVAVDHLAGSKLASSNSS